MTRPSQDTTSEGTADGQGAAVLVPTPARRRPTEAPTTLYEPDREGLATLLETLDGYQAAAGAWEAAILPARCRGYQPELLDMLCLTGRLAWGRLDGRAVGGTGSRPLRSSPIALFARPQADGPKLVEPLTPREQDVLRAISQGYSVPETARRLDVAPSTVAAHIKSIYGKLAVRSRVEALNRARSHGLI